MQSRVKIAFVVPIVFCLTATWASDAVGDLFQTLDINSDGVLSGREVADLRILDADKDGELSKTEFEHACELYVERRSSTDSDLFAQRDGNEDGRLSGNEISGYEYADLNSDGRIPLEEFLESGAMQRRELSSMLPMELRRLAIQRFDAIDVTGDGRLSGSETFGSEHVDFNRDRRITQEEFVAGMFLDAATTQALDPPSKQSRTQELLNLFVDAINEEKSSALFTQMRPELISLVDAPVLNFSLKQLHESHRKARFVSADVIQQSPAEANGQFDAVAPIPCASGEMKMHITIYDGKLLGLRFESPAIDAVGETIYTSLMTDDATQDEFARYYSPVCKTLFDYVVQSKDNDAAAMFHPEVIASVGRDKFDAVFSVIRSELGVMESIELESIGAERDASGVDMMTIAHRAKGSSGTLLITNKIQFVGMKGSLVAISTAPAEMNLVTVNKPTPVSTKIPRSPQLKEFEAKPDGVKFLMPGKPVRTFDDSQNVATWRLEHPSSQSIFTVQIFTFDSSFEAAADEFFGGLSQTLLTSTGGSIVESEKEQWNGHPAQFIAIKVDGKGYMARFDMIVGLKVYSMQWQGKEISEHIQKGLAEPFLRSLSVNENVELITPEVPDDDLPVAPPAPVP